MAKKIAVVILSISEDSELVVVFLPSLASQWSCWQCFIICSLRGPAVRNNFILFNEGQLLA